MGEAIYETNGSETAVLETLVSETLVSETLVSAGYSLSFRGYSALDRYMGFTPLPFIWAETDADISVLAKLFEGLRFPGRELADGAVDTAVCTAVNTVVCTGANTGVQCCYFRCIDPDDRSRPMDDPGASYRLLSLTQDWKTKRFRDPCGLYPLIREMRDGPPKTPASPEGVSGGKGRRIASPPVRASGDAASGGEPSELMGSGLKSPGLQSPGAEPWWDGIYPGASRYRAVMDGALILARYGLGNLPRTPVFQTLLRSFQNLSPGAPPNPESQRVLLTALLVSPWPDLGLELLKAAGFVEALWPELALLDNVDHSKEYHPEGNVWKHTLETFRYRKPAVRGRTAYDFRLSLGLLLHDVGKPLAASSGNRRFDGHAELGARAARKFLERLEFDREIIGDIFYLVKNHMLPAALPRLPLTRTEEVLESPLFPTLMELYRCDESSSFKGPDGYYESSSAYQAYLRYRRNPYRSADGKKLGREVPALPRFRDK
jgi:poly(A) polymerase